MSRYLQVYSVEITLTTGKVTNPTQEYLFGFTKTEKGYRVALVGGFRLDVNRMYCKDSITDTGKPELNETFTIFDFETKSQIGTGKILAILVQD